MVSFPKIKSLKQRILVTSALPYVHGIIHLGNLVGSILPADVYSRFKKLQGNEVVFICGSDVHGTPIEVEAFKQGIKAEDYAMKQHFLTKEFLKEFNFEFSFYGHTHSKENKFFTLDIFKKLYDNKLIYKKFSNQGFCSHCNRFLADRWIEGKCPKCNGLARADQCDDCGAILEPEEIIEARCIICNNKIEFKATEHFYLKSNELLNEVITWFDSIESSKLAKAITKGLLKQGLIDRCITRDIEWGFKVPLPGYEKKTIYVWFDAPIAYISFTKEYFDLIKKPELFKDYWKNNEVKLVQFMGKDNTFFHSLLFPTMLLGSRDDYRLADVLAVCAWLTSKDVKFSKSRGIGLNIESALKIRSADYWRYVLLSNYPENADAEFSMDFFKDKVNNELADVFGNLIHRTLTLINKLCNGVIPEINESTFTEKDKKLIKAINDFPDKIAVHYNNYTEFKEALIETLLFAKTGNVFLQEKAPWKKKLIDDDVKNTLYLLANLIKSLTICFYPVIPEKAQKIFDFLNLSSIKNENWSNAKLLTLPSNHKINKSYSLFRKISKNELIEIKSMLAGKSSLNEIKEKLKKT